MEPNEVSSFEQENERVVKSGKRLSIDTIAEFVQQIRNGLTEETTVVIELEPDVEMDITALQVLCSACKQAAAEGKKITHRGPAPRALLDLVAAVGAERHERCRNNNISCFRQFGGMKKWEN